MNPEKLLKHINKSTWYKQGASIIPFFALPYVSMFDEVGPENTIVVQDKHLNLGYFGKEQEKKKARKHINRFLKYPGLLSKTIKQWRFVARKQQAQLKVLINIPLGNDKELKLAVQRHISLTVQAWAPTLLIEDLDPWGDVILKEYTKKYQLSHAELAVLTGPNKLSYVQRERIDRFSIARKYSNISVKNLWKKYYWILASWESAPKTGLDYFEKLIKKDCANFKKAKQEVVKIYKYLNEELGKKQAIYKKYRFDLKTKKLFKLFSALSDWRDERKQKLMAQINYDLERFLERLSKHNKMPVSLLSYLYIQDLSDFKLSEKLVKILQKRQKSLHVTYGGKHYNLMFIYGSQAQVIAKALEKRVSSESNELVGRIAYSGVIRGKVKIINSISDFRKMRPNDILVSINTRPELMPAIRVAGAIVTDEGGMTCHAAIVSRELKIPCIVGTQSATSKFKDGDLVEVDAERGIVRKL
jgi:phosphohistidine swiveling domain-containing protein